MSLPEVQPSPQLPVVRPLAGEDLAAVLRGLRTGWYTTADLYPRYEAWAKEQGRDLVTRQAFGKAMRRFVGPTRTHIGGSGNAGRQFLLAAEPVSTRPVG